MGNDQRPKFEAFDFTNYENFYEKKAHGNLEYPVMVYFIDLYNSYMHAIRWHWHEEMEVIIVNSGSARFLTDDESFILSPGQGLILNQNVIHAIQCVEDTNCTFYSLVFHPNFLFGKSNSYMRTQFLLPTQSFSILKALVLDENDAWHESMLDALNEVIAVNLTKNYGYEIATRGYLCQFWANLIGRLPKTTENVHSPQISLDEQRVKQAMLFIRLHYAEPLTLEDIADSIPVSKSECCRCFKRTIQITPFEYLMKYRIFEASKKILDDNYATHSISDLALSVGFNNISYFNKLFKRYLDCTPTEYRAQVAVSEHNAENPFHIPLS